jgi:murein DD-endopeptidase MepM/ murein hydrolase activator NlpD
MITGRIIKSHAAFLGGLILLLMNSYGQQISGARYPQGYFRNPLGIPMSFLANFGELRPNHWHMGFDLRTNQKENLPVFAAANGYVAHIGIRALSFGRFMIINHPNGYSTLYAHLNEFYPELEKYVKDKQKEKESWAIELDFSEKIFVVRKGDTIARSGNTGGSRGPHLHFEILDTKTGRSLNTSLFGFAIKDNLPPVAKRLAVYDRSISTYLQMPQLHTAIKTDSGYYLKPKKILTGYRKLSFAIEAFDQVNGSSGKNGIYGASLYFDNKPQIQFLIDNINYPESDYINAHIDRKFKNNGGLYLQHLSRLPGFKGPIYTDIDGTGIIELNDTLIHSVNIEIADTDENLTELFFNIQFSDSLAQLQTRTSAGKKLMPGIVNIIEEKDFELFMPENCFYDTLPSIYFKQNVFSLGSISAQHRFNDPQYPVHAAFTVRIKPTFSISVADREKIVMQREWQAKIAVKKAQWQNGWLAAAFGDFGNFQLFIDKSPPKILPPVKEKDTMDFSALKKILLRPDDNSGIKSFRAELDGKWLMFTNDKAKDFVYIFDEQCPYGVHELKVRTEDIVGNITKKTWWFKRYPYTAPPPKKKAYKRRTVIQKKSVTKNQQLW